jgi:hypothetical protein
MFFIYNSWWHHFAFRRTSSGNGSVNIELILEETVVAHVELPSTTTLETLYDELTKKKTEIVIDVLLRTLGFLGNNFNYFDILTRLNDIEKKLEDIDP